MSSPSANGTTPPAVMDGAFGAVQRSVRALLVPSAALYCECNHERLREHFGRLRALDAALEDLRRRAFAAATRLLSLDPPPQKSGDTDFAHAIDGGRAP